MNMKKRVFAVIGIVLMLVPLCILGVSADEGETVVSDESYSPYVDYADYLYTYYRKSPYLPIRDVFNSKTGFGYANGKLDTIAVFSNISKNNVNDYISVGNTMLIDESVYKTLSTNGKVNYFLGNASWTLGYVGTESGHTGYRIYNSGKNYGAVYLTYQYGGYCDVCLFTNVGTDDRVQIVFESLGDESTADGYDELVFKKVAFRVRGTERLVIERTGIKDLRFGFAFSDNKYISGMGFLEAMLSKDVEGYNNWHFPRMAYDTLVADFNGQVAYDRGYEQGLDDCYDPAYNAGFHDARDGIELELQDHYELGLQEGEKLGYDKGHSDGRNDGYEDGLIDGEAAGYDIGYQAGLSYDTDMGSLVVSILESPMVLIESMLDFDLFGVNVAGLVKVLLTLSITAVIVFFVLKITRG